MDWTKGTQKTPGIDTLDSGDRLENQASIRLPADVAIDTLDSGDRLGNALTPGTACLTSGTDWGSLELQGLLKRRRPGNSRRICRI